GPLREAHRHHPRFQGDRGRTARRHSGAVLLLCRGHRGGRGGGEEGRGLIAARGARVRTGRCETTLLLVIQAAGGAPAVPVEASQSRARASSNAEYGIVMRVEGEGKCRIEATRDTDVAWTLPRCLGTVDDLYFISNSGERFWVLAALPKSLPPPGGPV